MEEIKQINSLNEVQLQILQDVFDNIIPESEIGTIPSASFLALSYNDFSEQFTDLINKTIKDIELRLEDGSLQWPQISKEEKSLYIAEFKKRNIRLFNELSLQLVNYYYTTEKVLKSIGIKSIPPYPDGNTVIEGDLYLLEQVFLKGEIYRKC